MNSPALRKTWEGRVVDGKYPLRQWLGGSARSEVFLTEAIGPPVQKAAIKLLPASFVDPDQQLARWRSIAGFAHPHLIRVFDSGRSELDSTAFLYIVMEYAEEDLSQILPQRPLTPTEAADFLPPTLDALSYVHRKGFVQGALKPSNIQAINNQLKIAVDRSIALGASVDRSRTPTVYDAPEIGAGPATPAADIWSLGITLAEALTQRAPASDRKPDPEVTDSIPEPFRGIARACLRREPGQRCSVADIRGMLEGISASASVPASPQQRLQPQRRSSRVFIIPLTAALVLAGIFVGRTVVTHPGSGEPSQTSQAAKQAPSPALEAPASRLPTPAVRPAPRSAAGGEVVHQVIPDVPGSARNTIQGKIKVVVRTDVDSSGKVTGTTLTTPGPSKYFANLALRAAQQWEFSPPVSDGQKVPSTWTLRFQFSRGSTQVFPARILR